MRRDSIKLGTPLRMYLQPTDRCNLSCIFCWRNHKKNDQNMLFEKELDDQKWLEIVKESCELGTNHFTITGGGEPLVRKDLFLKCAEIIKKFSKEKNKEIKCDITTNGTLIDQEIIKKLIKLKWDYICFSFHGTSQKINDYLMGKKGTLKKILKIIKSINKYKNMNNSSYPELTNRFVITNSNYFQMESMINLANKYNLSHICFTRLTPDSARLLPKLNINQKELKQLTKQIKKSKILARKYKIGLDFDFNVKDVENQVLKKRIKKIDKKKTQRKNNQKEIYCPLPFFEIVVLSDGYVNPCCTYRDISKEGLSDNLRNKRVIDVWQGNKFNKFRELILKSKPPAMCLSCFPDTSKYKQKVNYMS